MFCTGFVDVVLSDASTTVLFAPLAIPSSFVFNVSVKSFADNPLPLILSTLFSSAVLIILFCTGLVDDALRALSTVVLFAPVSIPSSLVL